MGNKKKKEESISDKQKKAFLEQFIANRYHIANTAKKVGVHRNTVLGWRKNDKEFRQAFEDLLETKIDDTEERLYLSAQGIPEIKNGKLVGWKSKPNVRALEILLKAQAKNRGYGDHIVIDDQRADDHEGKSDEELLAEIERIKKRYDDDE